MEEIQSTTIPTLNKQTSDSINQIAKALVLAQLKMSTAKKEAQNPFFKSKYADLNSVREACIPALNEAGISVVQPIMYIGEKSFIKTILLHESGEFISCLTEVLCSKPNDAQSLGSGQTYARRYGLQALCCVGTEDDDGNAASDKKVPAKQNEAVATVNPPTIYDKYEQALESAGFTDAEKELYAKTSKGVPFRQWTLTVINEQYSKLLIRVAEKKSLPK